METADLLRRVAEGFERLGISYLVTGSMATIAYGEPRFTNDIDVVAALSPAGIDGLLAAFPEPDYYLSRAAAEQAIRGAGQFNVIHPASGLKVDVMVASDSEFDRGRFARARQLAVFPDRTVAFASPEDVIVKKLLYFREGGSEKHLRDIAGVLRVQGAGIDRGYIADWAARLGVESEWRTVLEQHPPKPAG